MAFLAGKLMFLVLRPSNLLLLLALVGVVGVWCRRRWGATLACSPRSSCSLACTVAAGRPLADHPAGGSVPAARRAIPHKSTASSCSAAASMATSPRHAASRAFGDTMERFAAIPELARRYPDAQSAVHRRDLLDGRRRCRHRGRGDRRVPARAKACPKSGSFSRTAPARPATTRSSACRWPARNRASAGCWSPRPCTCRARSACSASPAGRKCMPWPVDYRTTGHVELVGEPVMATRLAELDARRLRMVRAPLLSAAGLYGCSIFPGPGPADMPAAHSRAGALSSRCSSPPCRRTLLPRRRRRRRRPRSCSARSTPRHRHGPAVIGSYAKGCLAGGVALPIDGPGWQAMRLSRNRNWGDPGWSPSSSGLARRGAGRRLAGPAGRRHGAATRRADAHRPRLAPDRPRCRHLADAHARPPADAEERETFSRPRCSSTARAPPTRRGSPTAQTR